MANQTYFNLIGPPGEGKTRLLLWLFQCLCQLPRATVVLINPKRIAGAHGARLGSQVMAKRNASLGSIQPMRKPLSAITRYGRMVSRSAAHAKAVRETIRSALGQANLDATPQLARLLYLSLGICRALQLTLADAVQLLRSGGAGAPFRRKLLPHLAADHAYHFFHQALSWFDSLSERRQDELSASTLARLRGLHL